MAVNYNFLKSLKGTAIGTVVPWTGDLSKIPTGWLECNNQSLLVDSYPMLYEIIGNKYGGILNVDFRLPNIAGKALVDYHSSHASISGYDIPQLHTDLINDSNDTGNESNFSRTSDIDLFAFYNEAVNNMLGFVTETDLNDPVFFDGVTVSGRVLGDHHIGTHVHANTFDVISKPSQFAEECQADGGAYNCAIPFGPCQDDCANLQFNRVEANNSAPDRQRIGIFDGTPAGGDKFYTGGAYSNADGWAARRNPGQNGSTNYNYVDSGNMDTEESISNPWSFAAVDTSSPYANFVNSGQDNLNAHTHPAQFFQITKGSMTTPATIVLNTVSRGNVQPVNSTNVGIGVIRANTETPNATVLHIIRAY